MSALISFPHVLAASVWPTASLIVFFTLFVGIVIYVFVVPKAVWNRDAQIPLEDPHRVGRSKESNRG